MKQFRWNISIFSKISCWISSCSCKFLSISLNFFCKAYKTMCIKWSYWETRTRKNVRLVKRYSFVIIRICFVISFHFSFGQYKFRYFSLSLFLSSMFSAMTVLRTVECISALIIQCLQVEVKSSIKRYVLVKTVKILN